MADLSDEGARLGRRPVHDGRIVHLSLDRVRLPDGSERELEFIRHAGASAVLPVLGALDEADPDVLLVRQYRYASGGYLYEVPAGMPEQEGEPWDAVARRELEEETGWRAGTLIPLTWIWTTPGFTDERIWLWLATNLEPGAPKLDEDEFLEVVRVPLSRALAWVAEGRIVDGKSVAILLFASRFALGPAASPNSPRNVSPGQGNPSSD